MPLHDSFKQPGNTAIAVPMKLAKMSSVPTADDLGFALSLAVKNQKNIVELPWKSSNNPNNYIIKVTCGQSLEEPTWFLHVGGDEDQPVLWNYDSADATLIHSLVAAECERTTYTAPLEQESMGFPAEVQLSNVDNLSSQTYLPREHEQPLPSQAEQSSVANTSLDWNNQTAPSAQPQNSGANQPTNGFSSRAPLNSAANPFGNVTQPEPFGSNQIPPVMPPQNQYVQPGSSEIIQQNPQAALAENQYQQAMPTRNGIEQGNSQTQPQRTPYSPQPGSKPLPAPIDLDRAAVDTIYKSFTNSETGFISHAAFLFFLVNEFNRYQKDPKPLSLVRFDLCIKPMHADATITPMPPKALQEAAKRIFSVMRSLDWVAHYEQEYAILMPFTGRQEAAQLTQRIASAISSAPLVPGLSSSMLGISFGIASMPDDCTHPGILLAAAQDAKNRARKASVPVMLFSDA